MELITRTFPQLSTEELYDIMVLRSEVFVVEQNCVYLDPDGIDKDSLHVFLRDEEGILAYARLFVKSTDPLTVQIGRVVAKVRRKGYGTVVLRECIRQAEACFGAEEIILEAQTYARPFYEAEGFVQTSEEFLEDGIPHICMKRAK
ncbi:MAG: GNAT family N-acetyltransferase [Solobacterium sp.]|nr:GNAT family N-acetyltransferase [Solobacterium sp.]